MSEPLELLVDGPDGLCAVHVSNPGRVSFPALGVTRRDVVRCFVAVGNGILGAVRDRPTMLERRQGERGEVFILRRVPRGAPPWVTSARLAGADGSELSDASPEYLDVTTVPARYARVDDLHAGLGDRSFRLEPLLELADRDGG